MFFLAQGDEVTCFNEVKERVPESFLPSIKSSTLTEEDFKSIIGQFTSGAPTEADISADLAGMKDELANFLRKKGWEHCGRLVHYEPDNPNYLP